MGEDDFAEGGATGGGETFGIVEGEIGVVQGRVLVVKKSGAENDGTDDKWPGPGAAANFIDSEDLTRQD